jgi:hypothetical protein
VKPLSIKDINALRVLLRKASKPAAQTPAQRNAARAAQRAAYKAEVLTWAIAEWHSRVERLKISCPQLWSLGAGECPTEYTRSLGERFKNRSSFSLTY